MVTQGTANKLDDVPKWHGVMLLPSLFLVVLVEVLVPG